MDWVTLFIIILSSLIFLFFLGVPVAYSFLFVNILFAYIFLGKDRADATNFKHLSIDQFFFLAPCSPLSPHGGDHVSLRDYPEYDEDFGKVDGESAREAEPVSGCRGGIFATLSGSSMAGCAMLGQTLLPEMEKKGYQSQITLGPIMGCGTLAAMIPPSALGVLLACLAQISVGDFLLSIIFSGLLMAALFALYIIVRFILQPELAPQHEIEKVSFREKVVLSVKYLLPLGLVIFAVIGLIIFGVATPTESAAVGALVCFILAFFYKGFRGEILKRSIVNIVNSVKITVMMFMILSGASAFSQLLAYTGASQNLVQLAVGLPLSLSLLSSSCSLFWFFLEHLWSHSLS